MCLLGQRIGDGLPVYRSLASQYGGYWWSGAQLGPVQPQPSFWPTSMVFKSVLIGGAAMKWNVPLHWNLQVRCFSKLKGITLTYLWRISQGLEYWQIEKGIQDCNACLWIEQAYRQILHDIYAKNMTEIVSLCYTGVYFNPAASEFEYLVKMLFLVLLSQSHHIYHIDLGVIFCWSKLNRVLHSSYWSKKRILCRSSVKGNYKSFHFKSLSWLVSPKTIHDSWRTTMYKRLINRFNSHSTLPVKPI